jgi:hypothetical protein
MAPNRRRKPITLEPGQDPASLPLKHPPRELFAQAVARGVNVDQAYREAGYAGNSASRRELRCSADVDARIRWLLAERIESDARVRAPGIKEEQDARLRLIHELEAIAYVDPGDLMQWDRDPVFDNEGNVIGYRDLLEITPSKHLTKAQRSAVKSVSRTVKRDGTTVKIDLNGKLEALNQLARILGMTQPDAPPASSTTINNTQVNVLGGQAETALEAARRLAFAIEKAARAAPLLEPTATGEPEVERKV